MEEYRYFVVFAYTSGWGTRFGWSEIERHQPIRSGADVVEIAAELGRKTGGMQVTVINWRRFEVGPDEGGTRG